MGRCTPSADPGITVTATSRSDRHHPPICQRVHSCPAAVPTLGRRRCLSPAPPPPGRPRGSQRFGAQLCCPRRFLEPPGHGLVQPVAQGPAPGASPAPRLGCTHLLSPPPAALRGTAWADRARARGAPCRHGGGAAAAAAGPGRVAGHRATTGAGARPRGRAHGALRGGLGRPRGRLVAEAAGPGRGALQAAAQEQAPHDALQHLLLAKLPLRPLQRPTQPGPLGPGRPATAPRHPAHAGAGAEPGALGAGHPLGAPADPPRLHGRAAAARGHATLPDPEPPGQPLQAPQPAAAPQRRPGWRRCAPLPVLHPRYPQAPEESAHGLLSGVPGLGGKRGPCVCVCGF